MKKAIETAKDEATAPVAICVPVDGELIVIYFEEIRYLEANSNYTRIYCVNSTHPYLARITLKAMEALLPVEFHRIHDSYIVAEKIIRRFNYGRTRLFAGSGIWLPVSRPYRKILILRFPSAVSK